MFVHTDQSSQLSFRTKRPRLPMVTCIGSRIQVEPLQSGSGLSIAMRNERCGLSMQTGYQRSALQSTGVEASVHAWNVPDPTPSTISNSHQDTVDTFLVFFISFLLLSFSVVPDSFPDDPTSNAAPHFLLSTPPPIA